MAFSGGDIRFRKSISSLFDSSRYADAKIECDGHVFPIHKSIVCTQSEYFSRAFDEKNGFKEAKTNTIELEDVEASTVRAMIEYMYHGDYKTDDLDDDTMPSIKVYAAAEMYQVEGLKEVAAKHFQQVVHGLFELPFFPNAIKTIYQSTLEHDRGLRDIVVCAAAFKIDALLKSPVLNDVLDEVGSFGKDLIHEIRKEEYQEKTKIICPSPSMYNPDYGISFEDQISDPLRKMRRQLPG
ncbi:BTB/POZ protein [Phyllosticta citriasiana]|uniref:BTB/POZ protein n=1 Tax=Phyllosticta citriasiana TaxID=595635 RepID=UPI0030FD8567